jgi:hypothetical protein
MLIGLCGAHRTGKSTLAGEFARRNKQFTFAATSVSAIMAAHGMDPAKDYPIAERIVMQNVILTELDAFWARFGESTIFDRTPLDTAAYLLADVQRENVEREFHDAICAYVERAFAITNRRFSMLVQLPPVLPLVEAEGKAPATPAYVEHIHQLISGLRCDERQHVRHLIMPRSYIDIDMRVKGLETATGRTLRNYLAEVETNTLNGVLTH